MTRTNAPNPGEYPTVVIAHDFAETYGGAERVIATAAELYPAAPFYTILGRDSVAKRMGVEDRFHTLLPASSVLFRRYRLLTPVLGAVVRMRKLPEADVLLTSSYAFAHHFATRNRAPQVCFCHSPMRFAWSMTDDYRERWAPGGLRGRAFRALAACVRRGDRRAAGRVTRYLAASRYVAQQLETFYGIDAEVLHPPVNCRLFYPNGDHGHDGYFLLCCRLVEPYKRPGLAIEAFRSLDARLVVAGDGPAYRELREKAASNVEFVGTLEQSDLRTLLQRCAAVLCPSRDDFGLVPLEAAACGRPSIAFRDGGALETVVPGVTGEFFGEQTADDLRRAVEHFDPDAYDPIQIRAHAERFDVPRFQERIQSIVAEAARGRKGQRVSEPPFTGGEFADAILEHPS
jgi:glycosyltransferase involved in cell wall biosynthesis